MEHSHRVRFLMCGQRTSKACIFKVTNDLHGPVAQIFPEHRNVTPQCGSGAGLGGATGAMMGVRKLMIEDSAPLGAHRHGAVTSSFPCNGRDAMHVQTGCH